MRLTDEFALPLAPDRVFELLLDLENVAPCVPGGDVDPPDGSGVYPGRVTVRLGPMKFTYEGTLRVSERDAGERRAIIEGAGLASGGTERARVRSVMEVLSEGTGSRVRIATDLEIRGRAAQMGAGIIGAVSRHMVRQTAECLAVRLAASDGPDHTRGQDPG